ncbi:MAG: alpha-L-fucosidase [Opitutales bacterium]
MSDHDAARAADAQHAEIGLQPDGSVDPAFHTEHPEAQWFPKAGLGLFIHWGISSVHGGVDLSWGMMADTPWDKGSPTLTPNEYYALADRFTADAYDPRQWLEPAYRAGVRYAVLTTKHHDGFTLWPSEYGDLGVHTHLGGRDLVAPFVEACRALDMKVGLYYSPPDWWFDRHVRNWRHRAADGPPLDMDHQPMKALPGESEAHGKARGELIRGQVDELLNRYGRIDLFWFDGKGEAERKGSAITNDLVRDLQPHIVINRRNPAGTPGDYDASECRLPAFRPKGWFECCHQWADGGWGYLRTERYKSAGWFLESLARLRSWDANFLPNVAPDRHGRLPTVALERMDAVARWMETGGESLFGVTGGPYPDQVNVPCTRRGDRVWYLHPPDGFAAPIRIRDCPRPQGVTLLRTGDVLPFSLRGSDLIIEIPLALRKGIMDTVKVELG